MYFSSTIPIWNAQIDALTRHTHTLTQCVFHQPICTTYCPAQCGSRLHLCGFLVGDFAWTNEIHRTDNCICNSEINKQRNTKTLSDTSCSIFHHPLHYAAQKYQADIFISGVFKHEHIWIDAVTVLLNNCIYTLYVCKHAYKNNMYVYI